MNATGCKALLSTLSQSETWMNGAVCAQVGLFLWFADNPRDAQRAIRICHTCPVRQKCLDYALDEPGLAGVWGGYGQRGRQLLRAKRIPAAS